MTKHIITIHWVIRVILQLDFLVLNIFEMLSYVAFQHIQFMIADNAERHDIRRIVFIVVVEEVLPYVYIQFWRRCQRLEVSCCKSFQGTPFSRELRLLNLVQSPLFVI